MKKLISLSLFITLYVGANAQSSYGFELNNYGGVSLSDFGNDGGINQTNAYSRANFISDLTGKYYIGKFGVGIRFFSGFFDRDNEAYQEDLTSYLSTTSQLSFLEYRLGYIVLGYQIGLSYDFELANNISLEPSFYAGNMDMTLPGDQLTYSQNGKTRTYVTNGIVETGFVFTPGLKLNFQLTDLIGISLNTQYLFSIMPEQTIDGINYTNLEMLPITEPRNFDPAAFSLGAGFYLRFNAKSKGE